MESLLNIGQAASASGLSAKMIRHYEEIGLLPKSKRSLSGYRTFNPSDIHTLSFIRQARSLGFSIKEVEALLGLWRNKRRSSAQVKRLAQTHIEDLNQRIEEMSAMKKVLQHLAARCDGNQRPECPILDGLASELNDNVVTPIRKKSSQRQLAA